MDKLGINGGFLIAQIINFVLVMALLYVLMWKPLTNALKARSEKIAEGLEDARAAELARANAERDAQKILDDRRAEAQKMVDAARGTGEEQAKVVLEEARREAEAIRAKARQDAEEERNATLSNVRAQVAQIAIAAAERVVGASLVDSKNAKAVIGDFFTSVPADAVKVGGDVEVTAALPLSDAEIAEVKERTGASSVKVRVDPSILGGLVIRSGEKLVDGSVRKNLGALKASLN